jgi:hypothetical protein
MADQEIRATHEDVEHFVSKLKEFHSSLDESGQAMLGTVLRLVIHGAWSDCRNCADVGSCPYLT